MQLHSSPSPTWTEPCHEKKNRDFCPCVFLEKHSGRCVNETCVNFQSHGSSSKDNQIIKQSVLGSISSGKLNGFESRPAKRPKSVSPSSRIIFLLGRDMTEFRC